MNKALAADVQASKQYLECILRRTSGELLSKILGSPDGIKMESIELSVVLTRTQHEGRMGSELDIGISVVVEPFPIEESK